MSSAPRNSKKIEHKSFKCGIPIFNLPLRKAKLVEMLDKSLTTKMFTIYFFQYSLKASRQSLLTGNILFTFAPATCFQGKVFFICYEDTLLLTLLFMINSLDKHRKKSTCFLLSISKQI